jgi:hypothetical protein
MMQGDVQTRKARGRLSREAMGRLGKVLETYFDDVRKEGVPDRFKELLDQYEQRRSPQASQSDSPDSKAEDTGQMAPKFQERHDKGSN